MGHRRCFLALAALALGPGCRGALSPEDLVGRWRGQAEHAGETTSLALEIDEDLGGKLSIPVVDVWDLSLGEGRLEGDAVVFGPLALRYHAASETLTGRLPAALVPVYDVPTTFERGAPLERPAPASPLSQTREPEWTFDTRAPVWAPTSTSDGAVYAGSDDGKLYALEASSGRLRYAFETGGAIRAEPVVWGEALFVHSDDGYLYRIDRGSGEEVWRFELDEAPLVRRSPTDEGTRYENFASAPAVTDEALYVGTPSGRLYCLGLDGSERWHFEAGDAVVSSPAVAAGRVYFGSFDGYVYALEADSGLPIWSHDTKAAVTSSPAVTERTVVLGSRSYDLLGLDADTGETSWKRYVWFSWVESSPRLDGSTGYIGSSDAQNLFAFDTATGRWIWSFDTGGSAWSRPAVTADTVYIGAVGVPGYLVDHRGGLFAVDKRTGEARWRHGASPIEGEVYGFASSPAVSESLVFVGGLDGRVYAFAR